MIGLFLNEKLISNTIYGLDGQHRRKMFPFSDESHPRSSICVDEGKIGLFP